MKHHETAFPCFTRLFDLQGPNDSQRLLVLCSNSDEICRIALRRLETSSDETRLPASLSCQISCITSSYMISINAIDEIDRRQQAIPVSNVVIYRNA